MKGYQSTIGFLCYLSKFYFPLGCCSRYGVLHEKQCQERHSNGLLSADTLFKIHSKLVNVRMERVH